MYNNRYEINILLVLFKKKNNEKGLLPQSDITVLSAVLDLTLSKDIVIYYDNHYYQNKLLKLLLFVS
jgi:hypothetical protein